MSTLKRDVVLIRTYLEEIRELDRQHPSLETVLKWVQEAFGPEYRILAIGEKVLIENGVRPEKVEYPKELRAEINSRISEYQERISRLRSGIVGLIQWNEASPDEVAQVISEVHAERKLLKAQLSDVEKDPALRRGKYFVGVRPPHPAAIKVDEMNSETDRAIERYERLKTEVTDVESLLEFLLSGSSIGEENASDSTSKDDDKAVHNELRNAHALIKRQKTQLRLGDMTKEKLELILVENPHIRRKNGTLNYSALGRVIERDNKTAKRWCEDLGVK